MPIRPVRAAKATAYIGAGIALGLAAVGGSYALWNKLVPAGAGTVQSADFLITLTGSNNPGTYNMVLSDGTPATVSLTSAATPLEDLFPGTPAYAGVSIGNATIAGSAFTVSATLPGPPVIADSGPGTGLSQYLSIQYATAADLVGCTAGLGYQDTFSAMQIPKGGSVAVCFRIQLTAAAPSELQGQSVSIAVPLSVAQIP